jgi:hypothetical protein
MTNQLGTISLASGQAPALAGARCEEAEQEQAERAERRRE